MHNLSVVFAAHNEEDVISQKIQNCLGLNYPPDLIQIIVVSDGSTDGTNAVLESINDPRVKIILSPSQSGKSISLNKARSHATGEIVLFTDANAMLDTDSARIMSRSFSDDVGCVSGELRYSDGDGHQAGGSLYWKYEVAVKKCESLIGCVVGGVGPIFAIRKDLWRELDAREVPDLALGLTALESGFRSIYVPEAYCVERVAESLNHEKNRYRRIVRRSIPTAAHSAGKLLKAGRLVGLNCLWWHKLFRYFTAPVALLAFVLGLASVSHPAGLAVVLLFAMAAVAGLLGMPRMATSKIRLFRLAHYAWTVQISGFLGVWDWLTGNNPGVWSVPKRALISGDKPIGAELRRSADESKL